MNKMSDHKIDKSAIREWKKGLITTQGWKLLVKWKDGTQYFIPFKYLKESNPVETASSSMLLAT